MLQSVRFSDNTLFLLDQRALPSKEVWLECTKWEEVRDAIKTLAVRGAPAIGIAAAYAMVLAFSDKSLRNHRGERLEVAASGLVGARPTAVNLAWAVNRMLERAQATRFESYEALLEEANLVFSEDLQMCLSIGAAGLPLIPPNATVMTHCNAGAIATAGYGTALGVIRAAHDAGLNIRVLACETRPLLQGARLTAWELMHDRIPVTLLTDNMAGHAMKTEKVDAVIVGADRIALNGDTANKIGTYALSVLAQHHGIPFYVAAPTSTIDGGTSHGDAILIEQRSAAEVVFAGGQRIAPDGVKVYNPAFDVTPAENITAIVTNAGILYPPYENKISALTKPRANRAKEADRC